MRAEAATATAPRQAAPSYPLLDFLPRLYLPLLLVFLAVTTWRPLRGTEDFWAHAAIGRWIWQNHTAPHQTLWLWSTPAIEWIAHSWLSELFVFALMQLGGAHFVLAATIFFAGAPFLWFWKLWARRGKINAFAALFFGFAIWCAHIRFQPRPELFTSFFLGLLLLFLIEQPRAMTRRNAFGVVAMFAVWANFHGGVALGLAFLFLTASCELLQQKFARPAWKLMILLAACAAAINFNPYGFSYWKALAPVGGEMFAMIDEWKSPWVDPALPLEASVFIGAVVAVAAFAWAKNPQRRWSQLAWLVFMSAFFLMARRNLWPCVLVSVAVAAANAQALSTLRLPELAPRLRVLARGLTVAVLLSGILILFSPEAISRQAGVLRLRATSRFLPRGVSETVLQQKLPTPVFNDYLRSGYLHWRFSGRPPIYIDLLNAYPDALLANYFEIIKRTPRGIAEWEKLQVNTVVFGDYTASDRLAPLAAYLDQSPQWEKLYSAEDGAVWVRRAALETRR